MACPFGYKASGDDSGSNVAPEIPKGHPPAPAGSAGRCPMMSNRSNEDDKRFNFDADPVSWFYQNQIKSEEEFQARKKEKLTKAKLRLHNIMEKKGKTLEWPEGPEFENPKLSIHSSELSDIDSDVASISGMVSIANSWLADGRFKPQADAFIQYGVYGAVALAAHTLYVSFGGLMAQKDAPAAMENDEWVSLAPVVVVALLGMCAVAISGSNKRSKKLLLLVVAGLILVYAVAAVLACFVLFRPTRLDPQMKAAVCAKNRGGKAKAVCAAYSTFDAGLSEWMMGLAYDAAIAAFGALYVCCITTWRIFEVTYTEVRAHKHKRRHKRRKHMIQWDKIKLEGPVSFCGAPPQAPGGAAGGAPRKGKAQS